jgi:hypothetical protein
MGNKSCFRNEKLNSQAFVMTNEWNLPSNGIFECDFVHLMDRPSSDDIISDDNINRLIEWFRFKYEEEKIDSFSLA